VVVPFYETGDGHVSEGSLCYRGHYVSAWKAHPRRLTSALRRGRFDPERGDYKTLLGEAARAVRAASSDGSLGVLVSANMPCGQLAALADFFKSAVPAKHVSVFAPPTDFAMLTGVAASGAPLAEPADIRGAECALAIGDVLGTHRILARPLHGLRERSHKAQLINIDAMDGCTARFATSRLSIKPCKQLPAVLALAMSAGLRREEIPLNVPDKDELSAASGLEPSEAARCVEDLRADPNSLVLLTVPAGRCSRADLLAAAAGWLARQTGSKLLPLYIYGNSPGAYAVSRSFGLTPAAQWFEAACGGEFSCVLLVDTDLLGIVPDAIASKALGEVECVISASPVSNPTTERADISLPVAFWFEADGEALDHRGRKIPLSAMGKTAAGIATPAELAARLAEDMGVEPVRAEQLDLARAWEQANAASKLSQEDFALEAEDGEGFTLISRTENLDLFEGNLSGQLDWVATIEPKALALLNGDDANSLGICDGDIVSVRTEIGRADLCARTSSAVAAKTIAVSPSARDTKNLFPWEPAGELIRTGPVKASLDAVRAKE